MGPRRLAILLGIVALGACKTDSELGSLDDHGGDGGDGREPDIVVRPSTVDFGTVDAGDLREATLTIENVGDDDLLLGDLWFEDPYVPVVQTLLGSPEVLAGESVDVVLTYEPTLMGSFAETMFVDSNDPDEPTAEVSLIAEVPSPKIEIDPLSYDFGTVENGVRETVTLEVSNVGDADLHITGYAYRASSIELKVLTDGGLGGGATLSPGASTEVVVSYTPADDTADEGDLHVYSDDPLAWDYVASQIGNGTEPSTGLVDYEVGVELTVDDEWDAYMDGVAFTGPGYNDWTRTDTFTWTLSSGDHVLAVHGKDVHTLIAGFLAAVSVDGTVTYVTGTSDFLLSGTNPGSSWTDPAFSDSSWSLAKRCTDSSPWGGSPTSLVSTGAEWVWDNSDCRTLGESWFRLHIRLP